MIDLKFLPYSMYAEGFVSDDDADILENYLNEDISKIEYKIIDCPVHNFYTSSPSHNLSDDNINWEKYKDILNPYIFNFFLQLTDNIKSAKLSLYFNLCKKDSFISPHYDGGSEIAFMMLYCPKKYENSNQFTSYLNCEKYFNTFNSYEKLPLTDNHVVSLFHERGKFYIVPSNLLHWVTTLNDDIDRITLMCAIYPEFKE